MLLEFQVENYLSFKKNTILSMIASTSTKELPDSIILMDRYSVLSSVALYGANASGKSNFLRAIQFMKKFIFDSARESQVGDAIEVNSFKLNSSCENHHSTFEMTFIVHDIEYKNESRNIVFRYGFQVSKKRVYSEWLFGRFTAQESSLFTRVEDDIRFGEKFNEGKRVYKAIGKIRETTLFLSLIASIKGENAPLTDSIMNWFKRLKDISSIADVNNYGITANFMSNSAMKEKIIKSFCLADICIEDITIEKEPFDIADLPNFIKKDFEKRGKIKDVHTISVKTQHLKYNEKNEEIGLETFDFNKEESDGSKKFFSLIGPILDALQHGLVLIIDEIDARLHPSLCDVLISLFNSKESNKNNAQLIFATHNTLIMNRKKLRRDQIYFIEKNKYGESDLYSLLDYKKIRNDASYDKDYLLGKYGAVPYLGNFETIISGDE
ncbi:AAA family ATPase [Desulfobacula sp.]